MQIIFFLDTSPDRFTVQKEFKELKQKVHPQRDLNKTLNPLTR